VETPGFSFCDLKRERRGQGSAGSSSSKAFPHDFRRNKPLNRMKISPPLRRQPRVAPVRGVQGHADKPATCCADNSRLVGSEPAGLFQLNADIIMAPVKIPFRATALVIIGAWTRRERDAFAECFSKGVKALRISCEPSQSTWSAMCFRFAVRNRVNRDAGQKVATKRGRGSSEVRRRKRQMSSILPQ
jgi:hypothetical protein